MTRPSREERRRLLAAAFAGVAAAGLAACGGGGGAASLPGPSPSPAPAPAPGGDTPRKSAKRGIAYDLATEPDMAALAAGVSWWYDWGLRPNAGAPAAPQAAQLWPRYEAIAGRTGVQLVGPAMSWGTMAGFADPVAWLDTFHQAYRAANGQRDPRIDALGFHWYDYGLKEQLDRLQKYGKPFWVTEFANWHRGDGSAEVDTVDKQMAQMTEMVALCESRADVFRYAWFTGRWTRDGDPHHTSLLAADGELTALGRHYLGLPF